MLELDDISTIFTLDYSIERNHTMVVLNDGEAICSCRLHLPVVFKSEPQLIVGNVDA